MNLKQRAKQLIKDIPAMFLAMMKRETPWYAKAMAVLTIGYTLSPIDLIPFRKRCIKKSHEIAKNFFYP